MFGLRSSPSTLVVPCSLRGAVTAEAGMGFAPLRLTAPRPKRAVMPIMYYDAVPGAGSGDAGGVGYSPSTPAVSEYAGVFEAGCDPAQVRASLNRGSSRRSATPVLEAQASQGVVAAAPPSNGKTTTTLDAEREIATPSVTPCYDDDKEEEEEEEEEDVDCLFQLEGVKEDDRYNGNNRQSVVVETRGNNNGSSKNISSSSCRSGQSAGGGMSAHVGRAVVPLAPSRYPSAHAVAYSARPCQGRASPAPGRRGPDLNSADVGQEEMRPRDAGCLRVPAAAAAAEKIVPGVGAGPSAVFFKPTALRTPRVIAPPGRRCVSGGMYRLRLSTSC